MQVVRRASLVFTLMFLLLAVIPAVVLRRLAVMPVSDAEQDAATGKVSLSGRPLRVASWNVQQGYTLEGLNNLHCAHNHLASLQPPADWIALQESDAMHVMS